MAQAQSAAQVAQASLRWVPGHQVSVHDWSQLCQYSGDARFEALHWGLDWGVRSGRLDPVWVRGEDFQEFFSDHGQRLSAVQVRARLARAAARLEQDQSQAAALRALQAEFGVRVV